MSRDVGLLVLRVGVGLMMALHGFGKVKDLLAGEFGFPDPLGIGALPSLILAALAEFACALLVVAGVKTRWSAIPVVLSMLTAAFVFHASDGWEKMEYPLLFAVPFLALVFTGGGRFSVDAWLGARRSAKH